MTNELNDIDQVEEYLTATLTNEPSDPKLVEPYGSLVIFKRPAMLQKFKHRAWVSKKLKEIEAEEDGGELHQHFDIWSKLNANVDKVLIPDEKGDVIFNGQKFTEYEKNDIAYMSVLEQYVVEEVYNKGWSDEDYLIKVWLMFVEWLNSMVEANPDDVKKS